MHSLDLTNGLTQHAHLGKAHIAYLQLAVQTDKHVCWLYVPMDDAAGVEEEKTISEASEELAGNIILPTLATLDTIGKRPTTELERQIDEMTVALAGKIAYDAGVGV